VTATASASLERELKTLLGPDNVLPGSTRAYLSDATESRNLKGKADAIALPKDAGQVTETVAWCYEHDVPVIPRGGGTAFTGGAVPMNGGVVLSLERMTKMRHLDPGLWRAAAEAGMITADLRRRARENGLFYPPDPGSAEQSQLGGNIATNAGGPHAFKYGVTGAWITGLEVVLAPGELVRVGGPIRKDVAGYDLKSLLIGSEGTLGVVTAAWVKLIPAPEKALPLAALYPDAETGCSAIEAALSSGVVPAALEYLDAGAVQATKAAFPTNIPDEAKFMVIADADGNAEEAARIHAELNEVLSEQAILVHAPTETKEIGALWRWRDGASHAVTAQRGGKVSEDIVVPLDRLKEAITRTVEIGRRHELETCSWGHAGDGNLHSTFMIDLDEPAELERAEQAAHELFALAVELKGSISGEHGVGLVKNGQLALQWAPRAIAMHEAIKQAFDPKGLLNPGKKLARTRANDD
jgi:glycolate oxidase subunit GlcD